MSAETVTIATADAPGCYGKLPAKGDFVTRRVGRAFVSAWDDWLQRSILSSRDALGAEWLDFYLTSPIWRFALGADCCGPHTVAGVLMPSVDKVGRYFPLMLGCELAAKIDLVGLAREAAAWYQAVEDLALASLAPEFRIEELERPIPLEIVTPFVSADAAEAAPSPGCHIEFDPAVGPAEFWRSFAPAPAGQTLWWTSGSQHIAPCVLICPGLPEPAAFASLLDGAWRERGWVTSRAGTEPSVI